MEVPPKYQYGGAGSALYKQIIEGLQWCHPPALRADAFTNLPQGISFLQKRGFYEAFCETPVHLDGNAVTKYRLCSGKWLSTTQRLRSNSECPMQAMFNQLGFARDPEWQQCLKDLE